MKTMTRPFVRLVASTLFPSALALLGACSTAENSSKTATVSMPSECRNLDHSQVNDLLRQRRAAQDAAAQTSTTQPPTSTAPQSQTSTLGNVPVQTSGGNLNPSTIALVDVSTLGAILGSQSNTGQPQTSTQPPSTQPTGPSSAQVNEAQQALNAQYSSCADAHSQQNAQYVADNSKIPQTCKDLPGLAACPDAPEADFKMPMPTLNGGQPMTQAELDAMYARAGISTVSSADLARALEQQMLAKSSLAGKRAGCSNTASTAPMVTQSRFRMGALPNNCGAPSEPAQTQPVTSDPAQTQPATTEPATTTQTAP